MLDTNALSAWANADTALLRVLPKDRLWHLPVVALAMLNGGYSKRARG